MNKPTLFLLVGATFVGALGTDAFAEPRRHNDLAEQVAVRHRRLLVKNRFEVTPLFESSIDADYQHTVGGGLKLEYHLGDMLSIGVVGIFSTAINTALVDEIFYSP